MKIIEGNPRAMENIDIQELIRLLKIPDINKIFCLQIKQVKEIYKDEIEDLNRRETLLREVETDGNIIRIDRDNYYSTLEDKKLKEYVDFLMKNPSIKETILENFFTILKPLHKKEDTFT